MSSFRRWVPGLLVRRVPGFSEKGLGAEENRQSLPHKDVCSRQPLARRQRPCGDTCSASYTPFQALSGMMYTVCGPGIWIAQAPSGTALTVSVMVPVC